MDLRQIPRQGEVKTSIKKTLTIKLRVVKDMLQKKMKYIYVNVSFRQFPVKGLNKEICAKKSVFYAHNEKKRIRNFLKSLFLRSELKFDIYGATRMELVILGGKVEDTPRP